MASPGKKALLLRLDPAVAAEVEALAAQEMRSVNGQIEWLLTEALRRLGRVPKPLTTRTHARREPPA